MKRADCNNRYDPQQAQRGTWGLLIFAGIFALAFFAASLWLFPYTRLLPQETGAGDQARQVQWGLLEGITSLATLSLVIGGFALTFREYRRSAIQHSRESAEAAFNIYKEIFDRLMNPEATAARRWIILNMEPRKEDCMDEETWLKTKDKLNERPPNWDKERAPGVEYLREALNVFDFIGFTAENYWDVEAELIKWMHPPIVKVWERVGAYIEREAIERNEPDFYQGARALGKMCLKWRQDHERPTPNIIKGAT